VRESKSLRAQADPDAHVGIRPKPTFRSLFELATTNSESGAVLLNETDHEETETSSASGDATEASLCSWWRRGTSKARYSYLSLTNMDANRGVYTGLGSIDVNILPSMVTRVNTSRTKASCCSRVTPGLDQRVDRSFNCSAVLSSFGILKVR
jgi:hypothetical protein